MVEGKLKRIQGSKPVCMFFWRDRANGASPGTNPRGWGQVNLRNCLGGCDPRALSYPHLERERKVKRGMEREGRPVRTFVGLSRRHTVGTWRGEGLYYKVTGMDEFDYEGRVGGERHGECGGMRGRDVVERDN